MASVYLLAFMRDNTMSTQKIMLVTAGVFTICLLVVLLANPKPGQAAETVGLYDCGQGFLQTEECGPIDRDYIFPHNS